MKDMPLYINNPNPREDWEPGDICYYWQFDTIHKAVFCRWTVGDHGWAAVFDIDPASKATDKDGYDYETARVTYDMLFKDRDDLISYVMGAFKQSLSEETR